MPPESPRRLFIKNFILPFTSKRTSARDPSADLHGFHCLHAHQRLRKPPIQLFVPLRVAAQPHGNIVCNNFKNSAHGVPRFQDPVNFPPHFFLHLPFSTTQSPFHF